MAQENLHPLNREENIPENWNTPDWQPESYPAMRTLPEMTPEQAASMDRIRKRMDEARAFAASRWSSVSDYFKWLYDERLEGNPFRDKFEPKHIVPPGGYHSPKVASAMLFASLYEVALKDEANEPIMPTEITAQLACYQVLRHGVPIYYIAEDFIRAVAATDLPEDFTLMDLHWPMPGMVLGFPVKFMQEYLGRDVCYVFAANCDHGEHCPPPWLALTEIGARPRILTPDKVCFLHYTWNEGMLGSYVSSYFKKDRVDETLTKYGYMDYTNAAPDMVKADDDAARALSTLIMKLLVVLNTRQQYVEREVMARPAKVNKRTGVTERTELWSPNMIGFKYRPQTQGGTGTHASPKQHWRRGHLTHQATGGKEGFVSISSLPHIQVGEKRVVDWTQVPVEVRAAFWACHKRVWLEPTLVNFDESEGTSTSGAKG